MSEYLGFRDLVARWVYSRQGLYLVMQWRDFPAPAFTIDGGKTRVWRVAEIESFEQQHPELLTEYARDRKIKGYYITMSRDRLGLQNRTEAVARLMKQRADIDGDD